MSVALLDGPIFFRKRVIWSGPCDKNNEILRKSFEVLTSPDSIAAAGSSDCLSVYHSTTANSVKNSKPRRIVTATTFRWRTYPCVCCYPRPLLDIQSTDLCCLPHLVKETLFFGESSLPRGALQISHAVYNLHSLFAGTRPAICDRWSPDMTVHSFDPSHPLMTSMSSDQSFSVQ